MNADMPTILAQAVSGIQGVCDDHLCLPLYCRGGVHAVLMLFGTYLSDTAVQRRIVATPPSFYGLQFTHARRTPEGDFLEEDSPIGHIAHHNAWLAFGTIQSLEKS